jgi:acetoin utilization deacetylase AcuC-like enzyme
MNTRVALAYSPNLYHDTGDFTVQSDLLYHHLGQISAVDQVYKPSEIKYPYPFPTAFRHPENSDRLETIFKAFENWGLLEKLELLKANPATQAEVETVHSVAYLEWLEKFCQTKPGEFAAEATPIATHSYEAALLAAGATLAAGRSVLNGTAQRALALTRPPGHHAGPQNAGGFCLLNNAAILAAVALQQPGIERILLLDWDVHHGNGTQAIFWQNPQVLFSSFHQFGPGIYPESGAVNEIGAAAGRGYTVNVPLPTNCADQLYQAAFQHVTNELAAQYRPDLIIVSAGQDGHFNDLRHMYLWEEGSGFGLTAQNYYYLTRHVVGLAETYCKGRCIFVQEGGYNLTNLTSSVLNLAAALLDLPVLIEEHPPIPIAATNIQANLQIILEPLQNELKEFWKF